MARLIQVAPAARWTMPWLELVLPLYALTLLAVYYGLDGLSVAMPDERVESVALWAAWIVGGALGGILALSGLLLAFYLLYSPFYLGKNLRRIVNPAVWSDPKEFRFYLCCFVLLCLLAALAILSLEVFLVAFIVLAGGAQLIWRLVL